MGKSVEQIGYELFIENRFMNSGSGMGVFRCHASLPQFLALRDALGQYYLWTVAPGQDFKGLFEFDGRDGFCLSHPFEQKRSQESPDLDNPMFCPMPKGADLYLNVGLNQIKDLVDRQYKIPRLRMENERLHKVLKPTNASTTYTTTTRTKDADTYKRVNDGEVYTISKTPGFSDSYQISHENKSHYEKVEGAWHSETQISNTSVFFMVPPLEGQLTLDDVAQIEDCWQKTMHIDELLAEYSQLGAFDLSRKNEIKKEIEQIRLQETVAIKPIILRVGASYLERKIHGLENKLAFSEKQMEEALEKSKNRALSKQEKAKGKAKYDELKQKIKPMRESLAQHQRALTGLQFLNDVKIS